MKKVVLTCLLFSAVFGVSDVVAQNARNGASDHRVPVPSQAPQASPAIGANAVNAVALSVPTAPPVTTFTPPNIAPTPNITAPGLMPAIPGAPAPPAAPPTGAKAPPSSFTTTLNLPQVPTLPPLPPVPGMPDVRLRPGANRFRN